MERTAKIAVIFLFLILFLFNRVPIAPATTWEVCFTPGQNCTEAIVKVLSQAKTSVYVQAYSFTSTPIAKALLDSHQRGVHIEVILDKSNVTGKSSPAGLLLNQNILMFIDSQHANSNNKVMIIDEETVITGSFNFTKAAQEKNAENVLVIKDKELAEKYLENWKKHRKHSEIYIGMRKNQ